MQFITKKDIGRKLSEEESKDLKDYIQGKSFHDLLEIHNVSDVTLRKLKNGRIPIKPRYYALVNHMVSLVNRIKETNINIKNHMDKFAV